MARELNVEDLSREDCLYIIQRPWLMEELSLQGHDDAMEQVEEVRLSVVRGEAEELEEVVVNHSATSEQNPYRTPSVQEAETATTPDLKPLEPPYSRHKKSLLVDEITRRNTELDPEDHLSTEGTKDELADRLTEDDAAQESDES